MRAHWRGYFRTSWNSLVTHGFLRSWGAFWVCSSRGYAGVGAITRVWVGFRRPGDGGGRGRGGVARGWRGSAHRLGVRGRASR